MSSPSHHLQSNQCPSQRRPHCRKLPRLQRRIQTPPMLLPSFIPPPISMQLPLRPSAKTTSSPKRLRTSYVAQPFGAHCSAGLKQVQRETSLLSPAGASFDSTQELLQRIGALFISFSKISGDENCKMSTEWNDFKIYIVCIDTIIKHEYTCNR